MREFLLSGIKIEDNAQWNNLFSKLNHDERIYVIEESEVRNVERELKRFASSALNDFFGREFFYPLSSFMKASRTSRDMLGKFRDDEV